MLEVLVGKVMEQSLVEVMEEEELASLKAQQRAFEELRNYELAEVQRLQEQERRRKEEKVGPVCKLQFDYSSRHKSHNLENIFGTSSAGGLRWHRFILFLD